MNRPACHDMSAVVVHWWSINNRRTQYHALTKRRKRVNMPFPFVEFEASLRDLRQIGSGTGHPEKGCYM